MKVYLVKWPNGEYTIVSGKTKFDIFDMLDEQGDPKSVVLWHIRGSAQGFCINLNYQPEGRSAEGEVSEWPATVTLSESNSIDFEHGPISGARFFEDGDEFDYNLWMQGETGPYTYKHALTHPVIKRPISRQARSMFKAQLAASELTNSTR